MSECDQLENEIQKLRFELSVTIPEEIQSAIESGDLRENSEFSEAVSRQNYTGIRLAQLNRRLTVCKSTYSVLTPKESVGVGSLIKVKNMVTNKTEYFKMVMTEISDISSDKYNEITLQSPLGKAFFSKNTGEKVIAKLPNGNSTYKILDIS